MSCKECEKVENETKQVFKEMFPLVDDCDLPWRPSHIRGFVEKRIAFEHEERTRHFTSQLCRVLCEVSPPKTHIVDMARIVVDLAKASENCRLKFEDKARILITVTENLNRHIKYAKELEQKVKELERQLKEKENTNAIPQS